MSLEARIRTIARQEIDAVPSHASPDLSELQQQITDLHKELHTVATRVADLEQAATQKTGATAQSDAAPRGSRARKAPGE